MNRNEVLKFTFFIFLSFFTFSCSSEMDQDNQVEQLSDLESITIDHSMKGWELYSWPVGNDWNYSLLPGTNRLKTYDEISNNQLIITGKNSLKLLLDKFPENEHIFWIGRGWLERTGSTEFGNISLPDDKTLNEIENYCIQKKLNLSISD